MRLCVAVTKSTHSPISPRVEVDVPQQCLKIRRSPSLSCALSLALSFCLAPPQPVKTIWTTYSCISLSPAPILPLPRALRKGLYIRANIPPNRMCVRVSCRAKYAALTAKWKRCEELFDPVFLKAKRVVEKDVLRNDRDHPFYKGDDNPNLRMLRCV